MSDLVLNRAGASLRIARLGAEARRWRTGDVDLLWPGDPAVWPDISPILFPVVGWTRDGVRIDGRRHDLDVHGFARRMRFEVEAQRDDFARLAARDDEETRAAYPFSFTLAVEYRLSATSLEICLDVGNDGEGPMPYACGLHPGFNWPFADAVREGARVVFERPERGEVPIIAPGGLISKEMRPVALEDGRALALDDALLAREALCFLDLASRALRWEQADGSALEMRLGDFPHVALWSRPPARFLSLEAWTGYGDPVGFAGDLRDKPSIRLLPSGERARHAASFHYFPAA